MYNKTYEYYVNPTKRLFCSDDEGTPISDLPRFYFGERPVFTMTFEDDVLTEGEKLVFVMDNENRFLDSHSTTGLAPVMAWCVHEITAEDVQNKSIDLELYCFGKKYADVINGHDNAVTCILSLFIKSIDENLNCTFSTLATTLAYAEPTIVSPDCVFDELPIDMYLTRDEMNALIAEVEAIQREAIEKAEQARQSAAVAEAAAREASQIAHDLKPIVLDAPPTTSTVGSVGQLAVWHDAEATDQSKADHEYHLLYIVESAEGKEYIWREDVTENQGNVVGGYPVLDENGKVASAQLPPMNYIPTSARGAANGVAPLNADGAVVAAGASFSQHVNVAYTKSIGIGGSVLNYGHSSIVFRDGKALNWYGIAGERCVASSNAIAFGRAVESGQYGVAFGKFSTTYTADNCAFKFGGGTEGYRRNIEELSWGGDLYIAGGHQQGITVIPAATTAYTLAEGVQHHTPEAASIYTLPAVTDATRTHECILTIKFSASVLTYEFQDSAGNTLVPLPLNGDIEAGSVVTFLCRYNPLLAQWVIYPVMDGKEAQE